MADIKWATQQRLQYIEIMAFYTGVVTRSDIARAFGISDAAATKDLKLYSQLAPRNLIYRHTVFGFVPSEDFEAMFADLAPANVLPMIANNQATAQGPYGDEQIYGVTVDTLPVPNRLPTAIVLAHVVRAIHQQKKVWVIYHSLSDRDSRPERIIEPHSLVYTGLRWHVRAYSSNTYDFRDFVLSRFEEARLLDEAAESNAEYDDDWMETVSLKLAPHPRLEEQKRHTLLLDYGANSDVIELPIRRSLIAYVLQRLMVDTTIDQSMNPSAYQLVLLNRDEIEPFAGWVFA